MQFAIWFIFHIILILNTCGDEVTNASPPKQLMMITTYFGEEWPESMNIFLLSLYQNHDISWTIITDLSTNTLIYPAEDISNLHIVQSNMENIREKASKIVGFDTKLTRPYKLCDYKPLYGVLFNEYITDYQYWGYGDLDNIVGGIMDTFNKHTKNTVLNSDIIITDNDMWANGPFSIIKNNNYMNKIYEKYDGASNANRVSFKELLTNQEYMKFDEYLFIDILKKEHHEKSIQVEPLVNPPCDIYKKHFIYYNGRIYLHRKQCSYYHFGGGTSNQANTYRAYIGYMTKKCFEKQNISGGNIAIGRIDNSFYCLLHVNGNGLIQLLGYDENVLKADRKGLFEVILDRYTIAENTTKIPPVLHELWTKSKPWLN